MVQISAGTQTQSQQGGSVTSSGGTQTGNSQNWDHLFPTADQIDLVSLHTPKTNKGVEAFTIPQKLIDGDKPIIDLVMRSESMKDKERQYWFNLTEVMNDSHKEKLRDILRKERIKLAEIEAKYKKPKVDPVIAAKKAQELAEKRSSQQALIAKKEADIEAKEAKEEDDILSELEDL